MRLIPAYRPRASALHSARPGVGVSFCVALAGCAVLFENPVVLIGVVAAAVGTGLAARVGPELGAALRLALPFALVIALVNAVVSQEGTTVLLRGWELLGQRFDVTLESLVYGVLAGLRIVSIVLAFALLSACVDPDDIVRLFRRVSYRSALTTALATRLVPVLASDARRRADAARCRPDPPGRAEIARAALAGTLDRALDAAASLEARGYASAQRPDRDRPPWSRHDTAVGLAATAIVSAGVLAKVAGVGAVTPYPSLEIATGGPELALTATILLLALAPFAGRRGRMGLAHA